MGRSTNWSANFHTGLHADECEVEGQCKAQGAPYNKNDPRHLCEGSNLRFVQQPVREQASHKNAPPSRRNAERGTTWGFCLVEICCMQLADPQTAVIGEHMACGPTKTFERQTINPRKATKDDDARIFLPRESPTVADTRCHGILRDTKDLCTAPTGLRARCSERRSCAECWNASQIISGQRMRRGFSTSVTTKPYRCPGA